MLTKPIPYYLCFCLPISVYLLGAFSVRDCENLSAERTPTLGRSRSEDSGRCLPPAIRASEPVCGAAAVSAARRLYSAAPGRRSAAEPGQINPSSQFSSATETVGVPGQPSLVPGEACSEQQIVTRIHSEYHVSTLQCGRCVTAWCE